jgi:hypothetical protein
MLKNICKILPHPLVSFIFCLFCVFFGQTSDIFLRHHDIGWHIAAGQLIRSLGVVPEYDIWSFTAGDTKWLNISWLWDIAVSKIYELGGFAPLVGMTIVLGAGVCALLTRICLFLGASTIFTLFGVLIVGLIFPFYQPPWDYVLSVAPQAVSLFFFLMFYFAIIGDVKEKNNKLFWFLPLLMLFWVNLHGGFLLGFMLIGAAFLASFWEHDFIALKKHGFLGVLCVATVLINPLGVDIIQGVMRSLNGAGNASITEWQAFSFGGDLWATAYLLLFVMTAQWKKSEIPLFCRIVVFICLIFGLLQRRNFVYFLFASLPVLLMSIEPWLLQFRGVIMRVQNIENDMKNPKFVFGFAFVAVIISVVIMMSMAMEKRFSEGVVLPKEFYPMEEIAYLRSHITASAPEPIFNHWNLGGYLILSLRDKVKVYIDGRADTAYPSSLIARPILQSYEKLEENKDIHFAIMPNYQPISQIYFMENPNWKVVFVGKVATVFERKK